MDELIQFDQHLFQLINHWDNGWLNAIMPLWREKTTWIPLYLLFSVWVGWKFKKAGLLFLLTAILCVGIADTMSSKIIKKSVERLRPCRTPGLADDVKLLVPCGGGHSFTSSHATNHFALAVFLVSTLGRFLKRIKIPLLLWAASIAFGQVYVGVHFPLDVISGSILGSLIAWAMSKIYWSAKIAHIYEQS